MKNNITIGNCFSLEKQTISTLNCPSAIYDLSHAIGNFLPELPASDNIISAKKEVYAGDFIISRMRSYLHEMAVVPQRNTPQIVSSEFCILRPKKRSPMSTNALLPICLSRHVQTILSLSQYGTEHPRFYDFALLDIPIPQPVIKISNQLAELTTQANLAFLKSEAVYKTATNFLLSELGLGNWQINRSNTSTSKLSEVIKANRWDAEYYMPRYTDIADALRRMPHEKLDDIVDIQKSIEPGSNAYQESGIPFIRVANLSQFGIYGVDKHLDPYEYGEIADTLSPRKNTILLTKDGTLGIAYKVEENMRAITSGAVLHLTTRRGIDPDYLTLVLNAMPTQMQAERDSGGAIIQHWRPDQIKEVIIPMLSTDKRKKLANESRKSFQLRRQSESLIQTAKSAVEVAIEKGEKVAMQLLEKNQ